MNARDINATETPPPDPTPLDANIESWRDHVANNRELGQHDLDELEDHLRGQIADLRLAGLDDDESFLIAVRRLGSVDALTGEYANEYSGRLWHQFAGRTDSGSSATGRDAVGFAVVAATVVCTAHYFAVLLGDGLAWTVMNASWLVTPVVAAWFVSVRRVRPIWVIPAIVGAAAAAFVLNVYPFVDSNAYSQSQILSLIHLPFVLWCLLVIPFSSNKPWSRERVMDFVRFTGEWCIYYLLIAVGGMVFTGLSVAVLSPVVPDALWLSEWVVLAGAAGAVVIAAWLVEAKQHVVENMAPILTMLFTPLFAMMLVLAAALYGINVVANDFSRGLLTLFDALLLVVLSLVLYSASARDPHRGPDAHDWMQLVAVCAALLLDAMVLTSMLLRVADLGFTPNRVAALGLNILLIVALAGVATFTWAFVRGHTTFFRVERWHASYLPTLPVWAAFVAVVLPLVFSFR